MSVAVGLRGAPGAFNVTALQVDTEGSCEGVKIFGEVPVHQIIPPTVGSMDSLVAAIDAGSLTQLVEFSDSDFSDTVKSSTHHDEYGELWWITQ